MAKRTLAQLQAAFAPKASKSYAHIFDFWKMNVGQMSTIRFLPDADDENPMGFLVENLTHELIINGKKETIACREMYGEECPICALSRSYYAADDKLNGKKFYRKKSYLGQCLIVDTPIEHDKDPIIKQVEIGPALFKGMQAAFGSGDMENPPEEMVGGYNFRIRKTQDGQYASYNTSSFATKQSDLMPDVIATVTPLLHDLKTLRAALLPLDTVKAKLQAAQNLSTTPATPAEVEEAGVALAKSEKVSDVLRARRASTEEAA